MKSNSKYLKEFRYTFTLFFTYVANFNITSRSDKSDEDHIFKISQRLKSLIDANDRKRKTSNLSIEERRDLSEGFRHKKASDIEIDAPIQEIANEWENQISRAIWDNNQCAKISLIKDDRNANNSSLFHLIARPGYLLPARDYIYRLYKVPPAILGINNFMALTFISVDANSDIPRSWFYVRGNMNSIVLLQPKGSKTLVTYIAEFNYNGWIPNLIVDLLAQNFVDRTLYSLKAKFENKSKLNTDALSVEEAAKKIFLARQEESKNKEFESVQSFVTDASTSKNDIKERIQILNKQLADMEKTEHKEKIDLSDLKKRVKSAIKIAKDSLNKN